MMLAAMAKSSAWAITEEEAAKLSAGINKVTALYELPMMDERGRAWLGLAMVGVEVYGSRVATVVIEANKRAKQRGQVTPITKTPPGPISAYDYSPTPGAAQA
jgi:acyl-CoA hydrolase